ncbi:hypothetical protein FB446DRAFT_795172 [Lentinula raphanica]|nr:hypothetical protein FB446DRAFT_795172 [Lentinula raphanica]
MPNVPMEQTLDSHRSDAVPNTSGSPPPYQQPELPPSADRERSLERHVANLINEVSDEREYSVLQAQRARFYEDKWKDAVRRHRRAEKLAFQRLMGVYFVNLLVSSSSPDLNPVALKTSQAKRAVLDQQASQLAAYSHRLAQADASTLYSTMIQSHLGFLSGEAFRMRHLGTNTNNANLVAASYRIEEMVSNIELERFRLDSARLSIVGLSSVTRTDRELAERVSKQRYPSVDDLVGHPFFKVAPVPVPEGPIHPATQYQLPVRVAPGPPVQGPQVPRPTTPVAGPPATPLVDSPHLLRRRGQYGYRGRGRVINRPRAPSPSSSDSCWSFSSEDLVYPPDEPDHAGPSSSGNGGYSGVSTPAGYSEQGSAGIRSP